VTTPVVIVHGLWLKGFEFLLLRDRLAAAGFAPTIFQYHSTRDSLGEVTAALAARLRSFAGPVHVVAHSLGGVIAFETFASNPELPQGRVVLLGAPVQGSRAARGLARWFWGPHVLGPLAIAKLCSPCDRRWDHEREIGVIAGSLSVGLGRFFAPLPVPNDGTVCVEEASLPGATAHLVLTVSHIGMLVSHSVALAVIGFMREGRFPPHTADQSGS
jgi:pimeloyl-ACP methyl ester carboxylesterase